MWTLNPPNYSLLYCIVLSYRVKILGQLSWHSNLYPLYKTKQRTDFLFKSGPNIGMKRHKNIFTFAPIIFNLLLSLSLFLPVAWLDWHFNFSSLSAKRSRMNRWEQRKHFLFKWSSSIAKKREKCYSVSRLASTISVLNYTTAPSLTISVKHPSHIIRTMTYNNHHNHTILFEQL